MKKIKITSICMILASAFAIPFGLVAQKVPDAKMDAIGKELKAAVKAGKLSEDEAKAKWEAIQKGGHGVAKKDHGDLKAISKKLKWAVKAGKLTEDQAWAKWKAIQGGRHDAKKEQVDWDTIGRKIKAAVKAGKLTEEEAAEKWAALKEKYGG